MAIHLVVTRLFVADRCRVTWLESALWWLVAAEGNKALNHCHGPFSEMYLEADLKENIWPLNVVLQLPQISWPQESAKMTGRSFFTEVLIYNWILQMDLEEMQLTYSFQNIFFLFILYLISHVGKNSLNSVYNRNAIKEFILLDLMSKIYENMLPIWTYPWKM